MWGHSCLSSCFLPPIQYLIKHFCSRIRFAYKGMTMNLKPCAPTHWHVFYTFINTFTIIVHAYSNFNSFKYTSTNNVQFIICGSCAHLSATHMQFPLSLSFVSECFIYNKWTKEILKWMFLIYGLHYTIISNVRYKN